MGVKKKKKKGMVEKKTLFSIFKSGSDENKNHQISLGLMTMTPWSVKTIRLKNHG